MIIDSHAHLHPSQADLEDWDFDGSEAALRHQQRILYAYHRPQAVTVSGEIVKDAWQLLWDERQPHRWAGRREVNFRLENERFVWEHEHEAYSAPVRPAADAARLIALMDAVGVDKAVLQASLPYSRFYGRMMRAYPGRFLPVGILQDDGAIDTAVAGVHALAADGLVGVYQNPIPGWPGFDDWHTPRFDPVWQAVDQLQLPVYTLGFVSPADVASTLPKLKTWIERFPSITRIMVHGLPPETLLHGDQYRVPDLVQGLVNDYDLYLELLPWAHRAYLHERTDEMIKTVFDTLGPSKLAWGTEFIKSAHPHTPEHYAQLKGYFATRCPYMSDHDRALILGGNLARVFGLA
jgi:hypothetical protein